MQAVTAIQPKVFLLFHSFWWSIWCWRLVVSVFSGGKGRSTGNVMFASSDGINASALVMIVEDSAAIKAAAERAAGTAAETPPFNFSTS